MTAACSAAISSLGRSRRRRAVVRSVLPNRPIVVRPSSPSSTNARAIASSVDSPAGPLGSAIEACGVGAPPSGARDGPAAPWGAGSALGLLSPLAAGPPSTGALGASPGATGEVPPAGAVEGDTVSGPVAGAGAGAALPAGALDAAGAGAAGGAVATGPGGRRIGLPSPADGADVPVLGNGAAPIVTVGPVRVAGAPFVTVAVNETGHRPAGGTTTTAQVPDVAVPDARTMGTERPATWAMMPTAANFPS